MKSIKLSPVVLSNGFDPYNTASLWEHLYFIMEPFEWRLPRDERDLPAILRRQAE